MRVFAVRRRRKLSRRERVELAAARVHDALAGLGPHADLHWRPERMIAEVRRAAGDLVIAQGDLSLPAATHRWLHAQAAGRPTPHPGSWEIAFVRVVHVVNLTDDDRDSFVAYVEQRSGRHQRSGYWTMRRCPDGFELAQVQDADDGEHHLSAPLVLNDGLDGPSR